MAAKKKYKVLGTYVGKDGKKHRLTDGTKLYTKKNGLNAEAVRAVARIRGISAYELAKEIGGVSAYEVAKELAVDNVASLEVHKKRKYKVLGTYVGADGKKHRLRTDTKLYTKKGDLNKEAIKALAELKGISEFDLQVQVMDNLRLKAGVNAGAVLRSYEGNRVARFLSSFGVDVDDLVKDLKAKKIDVDAAWILDESH